ncbi:Right-handed parallel beta-helix repeat-containing protein [Planctomycetales bacterium 10988]|nr:Right-handed parallel beta-helix repeat-containing protein [Planctomycetales bacterium 10988]
MTMANPVKLLRTKRSAEGMLRTEWMVLAALLWMVSLPVLASDIYINNLIGSDLLDGLAPERISERTGPVKTIAYGLKIAGKFDRLIITNTGVPYRESVSLVGKHSGSELKPFVIEGNGAILEGAEPIAPEKWFPYKGNILVFQPKRMSYPILFRDGVPMDRMANPESEEGILRLKPLQWCQYQGLIYLHLQQDESIFELNLSFPADSVGITMYRVQHVVIAELTVQGFQLDGISAHDGVRKGLLAAVTCRGNGRSGINVQGTSQVEIINSLLGDNGTAQLRVDEFSKTAVIDTEIIPSDVEEILKASQNAIVKEENSQVEEGPDFEN